MQTVTLNREQVAENIGCDIEDIGFESAGLEAAITYLAENVEGWHYHDTENWNRVCGELIRYRVSLHTEKGKCIAVANIDVMPVAELVDIDIDMIED